MKSKLLLGIVMVALNLPAPARLVRTWSDAELEKAADLIVIATPLATADLEETNSLDWPSTPTFHPQFRGVETTFRVLDVFKGMPANDRIVLRHYREELNWGSPPNGPSFIRFPSATTNRWLFYLVKDGAGRYAPVTGQVDPCLSVKPVTNLPARFMFSFPIRPPIADADPAIRHPVSVRVPTQLKVVRATDMLLVETDTNSFESATITVGTNMATGFQTAEDIYPASQFPMIKSGYGSMGDGTQLMPISRSWHTAQDGIPVPGKKYNVEVDMIIFETDIPPQHMWSPNGKNYKILWQRTLKKTVE